MALCTKRRANQTLQEAHWSEAIQMQPLRQVSVWEEPCKFRKRDHVIRDRMTPRPFMISTAKGQGAASLLNGVAHCSPHKDPTCTGKLLCIREMFGWREDCGSRADLWNEVVVNELDERRFEPEVEPERVAEQEPEGVCMKDSARGGRNLDSCYQAKTTVLPPHYRLDVYIHTYIYVALVTITAH